MKVTESTLRKIISENLKKESLLLLEDENKSDPNFEKIKSFYNQKILKVYKGKEGPELYIQKPDSAMTRFKKMRQDLQDYLNKNWQYSDVIIGYNGLTRSMKKALSGDGIRQAGTKHGCGLANDIKIHIRLPDSNEESGVESNIGKVKKGKKYIDADITATSKTDKRISIDGYGLARLKKENEEEFKKIMISLHALAEKNKKSKKKSSNIKNVIKDLLKKNPIKRYDDIIKNYQGTEVPDISHVTKFFDAFKTQKIEKKPMIKYTQPRNYKMAKNKELVRLIHNFCELPENSDIQWGGAFGSSNTAEGESKGRGADEFHHFEYTTQAGAAALLDSNHPVNKLVKAFGKQLGIDIKNMSSNKQASRLQRGKLYSYLLKYKEKLVDYESQEKIAKK